MSRIVRHKYDSVAHIVVIQKSIHAFRALIEKDPISTWLITWLQSKIILVFNSTTVSTPRESLTRHSLLEVKSTTMKFAVLASLLASAAAFAPAKEAAKTTSLAAFEDELGVQKPVSVSKRFSSTLTEVFCRRWNGDLT